MKRKQWQWFVFVVVGCLAGCTSPDEAAWEQAQTKGVGGCVDYLKAFPSGSHAQEAQKVVDDDHFNRLRQGLTASKVEAANLRSKGDFKGALSTLTAAVTLVEQEAETSQERLKELVDKIKDDRDSCERLAKEPVRVTATVNLTGHYLSSEVGASRWTRVNGDGRIENRLPYAVRDVVVQIWVGSSGVLSVDTKTGSDRSTSGGFAADDSIKRTYCTGRPLGPGEAFDFEFSGSINVVTRLSGSGGGVMTFYDPTPSYDIEVVSYERAK